MDYEKLYEEALERAKIWKYKSGMPTYKQSILDDIFPELREESEDEKIRKETIEYFKHYTGGDNVSIKIPKWIAWLEKQGEQEEPLVIDEGKAEMDYCFTKMMNGEKVSSAWSEEDEKILNTTISFLSEYAAKGYENAVMCIDWLESLKDRMKGE